MPTWLGIREVALAGSIKDYPESRALGMIEARIQPDTIGKPRHVLHNLHAAWRNQFCLRLAAVSQS